jgi:hypothetical protein
MRLALQVEHEVEAPARARSPLRSKSIAPMRPQATTHSRWSRQASRSIW